MYTFMLISSQWDTLMRLWISFSRIALQWRKKGAGSIPGMSPVALIII